MENQNDVRAMHEAEAEYQAGDRVAFDELAITESFIKFMTSKS